jgi:uncharacterized membrane protein YebE (DUF533 family)
MNAIFPTFLNKLYRKERISSFILIVGAVDAVLGGVNANGTLTILGFLTAGGALGYRWWCIQQAESSAERKSKQLYLPSSDRAPLPNLDNRRNTL